MPQNANRCGSSLSSLAAFRSHYRILAFTTSLVPPVLSWVRSSSTALTLVARRAKYRVKRNAEYERRGQAARFPSRAHRNVALLSGGTYVQPPTTTPHRRRLGPSISTYR